MRYAIIRVLAVLSVILGVNYITWRWLWSINWEAWWIALPLIIAETYSLVDTFFFCMTMWRSRPRPAPTSGPQGTVDVFITTYNEPIDLVMTTARAATEITYPHRTWVLDDGARPEMKQAAEAAGIGYITRSEDWADKPRHAKAGNLNNALFQTEGEFLLILDADQVPEPEILTNTLGYFADDPNVALVQTPQYFSNVDERDLLGSQAPLFYGPIQQGKDGWNAAFFCGSNAILRREALMQMGILGYVREIEENTQQSLRAAERLILKESRRAKDPELRQELGQLNQEIRQARTEISAGQPIADATYSLRTKVDEASQRLVDRDFTTMQADLAVIESIAPEGSTVVDGPVLDERQLDRIAVAELSPLGAVEVVRELVDMLNIDRGDEAQPIQPISTISVTEDMATSMQLHSLGWSTVYHNEILANGLAPEDLRTMLTQRLRWAQGTVQVMLRDNPLTKRGMKVPQRLMYFATMWSYLSGFTALIYLVAPVIYLVFGVMPVTAWSVDFFIRFLPYFLCNQLLFLVAAKGMKTWCGQQYSLALFPVWIAAFWTAARNVWFGKPLNFAVTKKDGRDDRGIPWRQIWPQLTAIAVLSVSMVIGLIRVAVGAADGTGTLVNTAWVIYDLVVMSVIVEAALHRGPAADSIEDDPAAEREIGRKSRT